MTRVLHVISHTDLDGVAAAATAWLAYSPERPVRLSLAGYGSVDALILESLESSIPFVVLDLFCQDARTVDAALHNLRGVPRASYYAEFYHDFFD